MIHPVVTFCAGRLSMMDYWIINALAACQMNLTNAYSALFNQVTLHCCQPSVTLTATCIHLPAVVDELWLWTDWQVLRLKKKQKGRIETAVKKCGQFCWIFVANLSRYQFAKSYQNVMRFITKLLPHLVLC